MVMKSRARLKAGSRYLHGAADTDISRSCVSTRRTYKVTYIARPRSDGGAHYKLVGTHHPPTGLEYTLVTSIWWRRLDL